jgi:hypothetical protein
MRTVFIILRTLILIAMLLISCSNLREAKLKAIPDFELNSEKCIITSPVAPSSSTNEYILENSLINQVYNLVLQMADSDMDSEVLTVEEAMLPSAIFCLPLRAACTICLWVC